MSSNELSPLLSFLDIKSTSEETIFVADGSIQQLVKSNPNRLALIVSNDSAEDIHLSTKNNVTTSRGIRLTKSGGYSEWRQDQFFSLPTKEWFIISDAAVTITVIEILRVV
jgi:hypothetical protein